MKITNFIKNKQKIKELVEIFEKKFVRFENVNIDELGETSNVNNKSINNSMNKLVKNTKPAPYQVPINSSKTKQQYQNPSKNSNTSNKTSQSHTNANSSNTNNSMQSQTNNNNSNKTFSSNTNNRTSLPNQLNPPPTAPISKSNPSNKTVSAPISTNNNTNTKTFQFRNPNVCSSTPIPSVQAPKADFTKPITSTNNALDSNSIFS